jgi:hypothetical protein
MPGPLWAAPCRRVFCVFGAAWRAPLRFIGAECRAGRFFVLPPEEAIYPVISSPAAWRAP